MFSSAAWGDTIVAEPGSNGGFAGGVFAASWTQTGFYDNVSISALLFGDYDDEAITGTAWLTTEIGPSATPASQIATDTISGSGSGFQHTLFSGLSLGPGTYYTVISSSSGALMAGWMQTSNSTPMSDFGETLGPSFVSFIGTVSIPDYAPSGTFSECTGPAGSGPVQLCLSRSPSNASMLFSVTGDPIDPIPEPTTLLLLGSGLAGLAGLGRKKFSRKT